VYLLSAFFFGYWTCSRQILKYLYKFYGEMSSFLGDKFEKNEMGGHVARVGEKQGVYRVFVGKPEGKTPLRGPGVGGRIILRWIFRKWDQKKYSHHQTKYIGK
jgi:hypothetical protein